MTELNDLIGLHKLSGVDYSTEHIKDYGDMQQCNAINFVLDGITYTAVEDANDGYRSAMREIKVSHFKVTNRFKPVKVVGTMRLQIDSDGCDILDLIDVITGKIVLSVGTNHLHDYYPSFVYEWTPENLCLNQGKSENSV